MRHIFAKLLFAASISVFFINATAQTAIDAIDGWEMSGKADLVTMIPSGGLANQNFVYRISSLQGIAVADKNSFEQLIEKDLLQSNWKEKAKGLQNKIGNVNVFLNEVTDSSSKKIYVAYFYYTFGKNKIRFAKTHGTDDKYFLSNFKIAATHFANLAQKDGGTSVVNTPDKPINPPIGQTNKPANPIEGSLKTSDIHLVIIHLEYEYGLGGAIYPVYNPYILFKDGTIYDEPNTLDLAASKRNDPKKWGVWKMEGGLLKITWEAKPAKNKYSEWKKDSYQAAAIAKKGETISGSFKTMSGGGNTALGGDVMIVVSNTITFNDQGQFTLAKVSGGSTSTVTSYYKGKDAGTYTLDGYTIELKLNSGKIERKFFYFYPDDRRYFGIGSSVYVPRNK
jgi:hypothetical protein